QPAVASHLALLPASLLSFRHTPTHSCLENTGINITCSHPNIQTGDYIQWYRRLPGRGPAFLMSIRKDSRPVEELEGWLVVAADRRSSALWLTEPRLRDAAVYYCALRVGEGMEGGTWAVFSEISG
uniref:Ig-like domain-containing protein n=1 Tax=Cairina moschata TaxID=8855 RepID=A0A8C3C6V1_CAIMO